MRVLKMLTVVVLSVIISTSCLAVGTSRVETRVIFYNLVVNSGHQDIPPLKILESNVINAWTDGTEIVITTGILAVMNTDEVALILGHEIAHAINHDPDNGYVFVTPNNTEAHADKLGAFIMMRAGYNICEGVNSFKVFKALFGDTADPIGHPDFAYRYDQLDLPLCHKL